MIGLNMSYNVYHRFPKHIRFVNLSPKGFNLFHFQMVKILPLKIK